MNVEKIIRRSVYAEKLRAFGDFAFSEEHAFQHRGRWREFFRHRIGPQFDGRIIVEIGCADAAYVSRIAAKHPTSGFVGLDWKCKALHDGAVRIDERRLGNVALLRGRGQDILKMFDTNEVDEIWVFHPDPCDRDVELMNRLIAERFLVDAHHVLRDNTSVLSLKTDHPGYYQWVLGLFGLPEPAWFQDARGHTAKDAAHPRVRGGDLMRRDDIPKPSEKCLKCFDVTVNTANYWQDPAALARTSARYFSGEVTFFESRFIKKRLPIYYMEMRKRTAPRC